MTIEITVLVSALSVAIALYFGLSTKRRNDRTDAQKEGADMTTVVVKLETISSGVNEIKSDLRNVRDDVNATRERLIVCEQSTKQAHKRLDEMCNVRHRSTTPKKAEGE
jgi:outer membrane murein-binding lipoprotein Lpp